MESSTGGYIWTLLTIAGPVVLGLAIAYATLQRRRRRAEPAVLPRDEKGRPVQDTPSGESKT